MAKSLPHLEKHSFSVNGTHINYSIGGSGPALLLWHGFLGTSYSWHKVIPELIDDFQLIVPDMRGYGDSSKPSSGYDGSTLCEDFRALLRHLGVNRVRLCAHDMGAPPALIWAGRHPEEVAGLAYLDDPVLTTQTVAPLFSFSEQSWKHLGGLWWWPMAFANDMPERLIVGKESEFLTWFYQNYCHDPLSISNDTVTEYARTFRDVEGVRGAFGVYRELFETIRQTEHLLKGGMRIGIPILALGGDKSMGDLPLKMMQQIAANVSGGSIDNCGHFLPEERPSELATALKEHFHPIRA